MCRNLIVIKKVVDNISKYNEYLIGIHNYYNKAMFISIDMSNIYEEIHSVVRKTLRETRAFQVPNYLNNG